ncbi:MAG TPA: ChbG/HpnK family deacetylase, partial [Rhizomicrobium sp.]|nr:ChbG/HpnK family deacetylase [Rhizomicrobium sp.]
MPFHAEPNAGDGEMAREMGYDPDARLLIVNCDDLGSSRSANIAIERALRRGIAGSASLMTPCPWARPAAEACAGLDVGVHLTLTSEYPAYRWRSLTGGKSLRDKDGYLPRTVHEVWASADPDEIEEECAAQINLALAWGIDVSHLNSHMDVLQLDRRHFDMLMRLGARYRLPIRLCRGSFEWPFARISRALVARAGLVTADTFMTPPWG